MQRYVAGMLKRFLAVIIITVSIIPGISVMCPGMAVEAAEYTVSGDTSQKLYESQSENSKVVANVIPGNSFTILETVKDDQGRNWHHVSLAGGTTGYIIASRVIEVEQENAQPQAEAPAENADEATAVEEQQNPENGEAAPEEPEAADNSLEDNENEEDDEAGEDEGLTNISVRILSNTNLRDEPSLDGNILVVIPKDVTIIPYEKIETNSYYWYRLTYLTQTGYVRADTVEELMVEAEEETEEEVSEESTESAPVSTPPKVVRRSTSNTVSYEDSYDRRHKWDDPEITSGDEKTHKRILDIYIFIFGVFAAVFMVVGISLLGNALRSMKRLFQPNRKRRKKRGAGRE